MSGRFMGHGVIINTVAREYPESRIDSDAMARTLKQIGFKIQQHENCNRQVLNQQKHNLFHDLIRVRVLNKQWGFKKLTGTNNHSLIFIEDICEWSR